MNDAMAQQRHAEQVRTTARAWVLKLDDPELRQWAEPFADWCAERSFSGWWSAYDTQPNGWWHRLGKTPSFKRWWTTFYYLSIRETDPDSDFRVFLPNSPR